MIESKYNNYINKTEDESDDDYKYRLILNKARKDRRLSGVSWEDIKDLLDINTTKDHLRKKAAGILEYDNYLKNNNNYYDNDNVDLEEFKKEKIKLQDQKRELNKRLREWARAEHIQDKIIEAVNDLNINNPIKHININPSKNSNNQTENKEAALLLSDWHVGMTTDNINNKFNYDVLYKRIDILLNKTIEYIELHNIKKLHVFALGDLIHGLIHVTARISQEEDVVKQTMKTAEILCIILNILSEYVEDNLIVYWCRGNHERITPNLKESIASESFNDLILWYLKARLNNDDTNNIIFVDNQYDSEIIVTDILNSKIFAVHGHRDKITNVVQNLSLMLKVFPDYVFMGHFHSSQEKDILGSEVIVNSSLCGTDDYAYNKRLGGRPAQKLIIFNQEGKECIYNIYLDN